MKKRNILYLLLTLTITLIMTGCSPKTNKQDGKISIVTTTNIYADIAKNVVGKYGTAKAIIANSAIDPHDFEPTTNDAKTLSEADIVVANGLGYDSWVNKLSKGVDKKPVLVGEDLMKLKVGDNPHIWYNLSMPEKYVNYLVERLGKLQPKHRAYFEAQAKQYLKAINEIKQLAHGIKTKDNKPVFVSEPVFDYALEEAGIKIGDRDFEEAIEKETDPSAQVIDQMTAAIKQRKIAFFVNNVQASSSTVKTFVKLAKAHNIPVLKVRETIPNNTTYLAWMRENYQNLAKVTQ
ncbi:metal ABC transporter solute-binding protein, Zn/Mn family [Lactobacillus gigeriorum]|uniref:ABC transporter solute-binding component n=1 Tax=Lactobacillus gigeriorum DSM 23908 = CRBIP 24.85 TaxID=1423751 RepID=I7KQ04_9LACO|nr:zinc ABC transporter substrate-binding protein [Lactobacillus gigeriorum]KRN14245.1 ABC transporter solute-binding component [Lactobacillus gigeriorum DSM 23908 = CRBIP 24.85]CCI87644.1 ABC transporter, periplasmatic component [Lactobacillus gigeriorum DSM 23908 = CRBIP 24.85]